MMNNGNCWRNNDKKKTVYKQNHNDIGNNDTKRQ